MYICVYMYICIGPRLWRCATDTRKMKYVYMCIYVYMYRAACMEMCLHKRRLTQRQKSFRGCETLSPGDRFKRLKFALFFPNCRSAVLRCDAVCNRALQCVAVCCSGTASANLLQFVAVCTLFHLLCCSVHIVCCSVHIVCCSVHIVSLALAYVRARAHALPLLPPPPSLSHPDTQGQRSRSTQKGTSSRRSILLRFRLSQILSSTIATCTSVESRISVTNEKRTYVENLKLSTLLDLLTQRAHPLSHHPPPLCLSHLFLAIVLH